MEPFRTHRGILVALDRAQVDTDQIIPKQFLKQIGRTGFGEHLFHDWRYAADGALNPDFPLNAERFRHASILVTRHNFGCGSSREHAVWALKQYGVHVVIAPWHDQSGTRVPAFADIFRTNSVKNALLTVELAEADVDALMQLVERHVGLEATVDLEKQRVVVHLDEELGFHFAMDPAVKARMVRGLDDIAITLHHEEAIRAFEQRHNDQRTRAALS